MQDGVWILCKCHFRYRVGLIQFTSETRARFSYRVVSISAVHQIRAKRTYTLCVEYVWRLIIFVRLPGERCHQSSGALRTLSSVPWCYVSKFVGSSHEFFALLSEVRYFFRRSPGSHASLDSVVSALFLREIVDVSTLCSHLVLVDLGKWCSWRMLLEMFPRHAKEARSGRSPCRIRQVGTRTDGDLCYGDHNGSR